MNLTKYRQPRPIWVSVLAKGFMRLSMAGAVFSTFADEKIAGLICLGSGFLADMFNEFFILYDRELTEQEKNEQ